MLSDELEFPAVTLPWIHRGVPVHFVPAVEGIAAPRVVPTSSRRPRAATIAISHVQFSNGCRQDLDAFGRDQGRPQPRGVRAASPWAPFPIDVKRSGIDALATAGHKWLCAGYGAGFVYVSRELLARRPPRTIGWMSGEDPFAFDNRQLQGPAVEPRAPSSAARPSPRSSRWARRSTTSRASVSPPSPSGSWPQHVPDLPARPAPASRCSRPGGEHRSGETLVACRRARRRAQAFLQGAWASP